MSIEISDKERKLIMQRYWLEVRRGVSSAERPNIVIEHLGMFHIVHNKVVKRLIRIAKLPNRVEKLGEYSKLNKLRKLRLKYRWSKTRVNKSIFNTNNFKSL